MSFDIVEQFEKKVTDFFGAPYGIAVDSCTHGLELCLRYTKSDFISVPEHTYISIPFLANKLNIELKWSREEWEDFYYITDNIIDAAVMWKEDSYISDTFMCLSFQYRKHLSLGRGGMILTDDQHAQDALKKMSYDGRNPETPWRQQNISSMGYHYYMTPETAKLGIEKLPAAKEKKPKKWKLSDWPNLRDMEVFK